MKLNTLFTAMTLATVTSICAQANAAPTYTNFPVTVKNYQGDKTTSVAYSGQVARQVLHNSLKKLAGKGNGAANPELLAQMQSYFSGKKEGRAIIDPVTKEGFSIAPSLIDDISKGKNLAGKAYKGIVNGWPGNMTAAEVLSFMLEKASSANAGYDLVNGMDYPQLISKFTMGAVFYNQAVNNYLDEKLAADVKPNNKPYKKGAPYTGKEHVWDEAFGYFGAPVNALNLDAKTNYAIAKAKKEAFSAADFNENGKIDLATEMLYAHAYYAANSDKSGKSNYLHTITKAFIDGRQIITDAKGEQLSEQQRSALMTQAELIKKNWELVIAEAAFKYAGSVYEYAVKVQTAVDNNQSPEKDYKSYIHIWSELKGFSMSLQTGGKDLGGLAVHMNRLIGFSPVLLGNTQVVGIDDKGNFKQASSVTMTEYALQMLKLQKLLSENYELQVRKQDQLAKLAELAEKLGSGVNTEND
ncbi:MAG: DUF4856 domain-containing protein [Oceanospirillaceae bacterium]